MRREGLAERLDLPSGRNAGLLPFLEEI